MGKNVPKIEIKTYEHRNIGELDNITLGDLGIYLDGMEIRGLRNIEIFLEEGNFNIVSMDFVAEVEIDIDALIEVRATTKEIKERLDRGTT